jgi:TolA-binding protein
VTRPGGGYQPAYGGSYHPAPPATANGIHSRPGTIAGPGYQPGTGGWAANGTHPRPGSENRPGTGGWAGNGAHPWPGGENRPGHGGGQSNTLVNQPTHINNHPTTTTNYGPVTTNNYTSNVSNTTHTSNVHQTSIHQNNLSQHLVSNRAAFVHRPGYGSAGWGSDGAWYGSYHYLHEDWHHGGWNYWGGAPPLGYAAGTTFGWLGAVGRALAYSNPYCEAPETSGGASFLDYSQPIGLPTSLSVNVQVPAPVPVDSAAPGYGQGLTPPPDDQYPPTPTPQDDQYPLTPPPPPEGQYPTDAPPAAAPPQPGGAGDADAQQAAQQTLDEARAAFKRGDYATAQDLAEQALRNVPGDTTLHEFRALTLFAQGKYRDAAGAVYAVLAAGPGWNWDTLRALYPDVATYTAQLRALEGYQRNHPDAAEASFLLAYNYLSLGSTEAAVRMLRLTVRANPKDTLSPQILKMLTQAPAADDRPQPGQ